MTDKNLVNKSLIKMHLIFSGVAFLLFSIFLLLASKEIALQYFQGKVLAITHIATLCWFTPFLFALFYQYAPQIFSRKLYSKLLAQISFWLLVVGSLMLVHAFWLNRFDKLLTIPSHILLFPFLFLLVNVIITSVKSPKRDIEQWYFITSVIWLFLTAVVGFLLAMNFTKPIISASHLEWLKLHANIGFIGWFLLFIIGLSLKSTTGNDSKKADKRLLRVSFFLINFGLVFYFFDKGHNNSQLIDLPTVILILGVLGSIAYTAKTSTKKNAHGTKIILLPLLVLLLPVILAFYLVFTTHDDNDFIVSVSIVYGLSVLLGFVALWTFSQLKMLFSFINPMHDTNNNDEEELKLKSGTNILSTIYLSSYIVAVVSLIIGILLKEEVVNRVASFILLLSSILFNLMLFRVLFAKVKTTKKEQALIITN